VPYELDPYDEWIKRDANPDNAEIVADSGNLYLRHWNGDVFWYTGTAMNWVNMSTQRKVVPGGKVVQLAAGGERLYCLCLSGDIWQILDGYLDD